MRRKLMLITIGAWRVEPDWEKGWEEYLWADVRHLLFWTWYKLGYRKKNFFSALWQPFILRLMHYKLKLDAWWEFVRLVSEDQRPLVSCLSCLSVVGPLTSSVSKKKIPSGEKMLWKLLKSIAPWKLKSVLQFFHQPLVYCLNCFLRVRL